MPEVESPSTAQHSTRAIQPKYPHREIAELLAAAIVRLRAKSQSPQQITHCEVSLDFSANQRVNANPSYTQGAHQ